MDSFTSLNLSTENSIASSEKVNAAIEFLKKVLLETEAENNKIEQLFHDINLNKSEFNQDVQNQVSELSELQRKLKIADLSTTSISLAQIPHPLDFKLKRFSIELNKQLRILDSNIKKQSELNKIYEHEIENFNQFSPNFNEEEHEEKLRRVKQYEHMIKSFQEKLISHDPKKYDINVLQEQIKNLEQLRNECAKLKLL